MLTKYYKPLFKVLILVVVALFFLIPALCFGADYYVRTDGDNGNDGSADDAGHAWQTVAYSESQASAGDTIHIASGEYPEQITINVSGTSENRITFIGSGTVSIRQIELENADYITLDSLTIGYDSNPSHSHLHIAKGSDYIIVTGCTIDGEYALNIEGISMYGDYGTVTGSAVQHINNTYCISLGSVEGGGTNNTVTLSTVKDSWDADAFRVHGSNHTISYNEVTNITIEAYDNHADFVQWFPNDNNCSSSYDIKNIVIEGNYVHDCEVQIFYGNNVCYESGVTEDNIVFRNNVFAHVGLAGQWHGNNNTITNLNFYNNVFYQCGYKYYIIGTIRTYSTHALIINSGASGEIKNNVFLESGDDPILTYKGWFSCPGGYTHSNNYVAGPSYAEKKFSETGLVNGGDPKFNNEAGYDFTIIDGGTSVLVDKGTTIASFSTDKDGNFRPQDNGWDLGAFEWNSDNNYNNSPAPSPPNNLKIQTN
jgi:hypothetical protein